MCSRTARVQAIDWPRVRNPFVKRERVVHMMNMPASNAKTRFDCFGREHISVDDSGRKTRSKLLGDREEALDISVFLSFPRCPANLVGDPLHEERSVVSALVVHEGGVDGRVYVPLNRRTIRKFTSFSCVEAEPDLVYDIISLWQKVHRTTVLSSVLGQTFENREFVERHVHLHRHPSALCRI